MGLAHQRVGGADVVSEDVDHGHVVADLFEGRLVADTAGQLEAVPVDGGGAVVQVRRVLGGEEDRALPASDLVRVRVRGRVSPNPSPSPSPNPNPNLTLTWCSRLS